MKTKEEIENICSNIVDSESINDQHKQSVYEGCILGYTQCQEDIPKLLFNFANALNEETGFPLNSEGFEEYITEFLNKHK